jgi:WD40 repeat protein
LTHDTESWLRSLPDESRSYSLRHLPEVLAETGDLKPLSRMLRSFAFLEAKIAEIGIDACLNDFRLAAASADAMEPGAAGLVQEIDELASIRRVLEREANHLRSEDTIQTTGFIAGQLRNSAGVMGARVVVELAEARLAAIGAARLETRWGSGGGAMPLMQTLWIRNADGFAGPFALTSDCRLGLFAAEGGRVELWDLGTEEKLGTLEHPSQLADVAVSGDGRRAMTACGSGVLKVWDLDNGDNSRSFVHEPEAERVSITADGRLGISASSKAVKVWDLETGRALRTLDGPGARVLGLAISPDGRRIAVAARDGSFRVWDLEVGQLTSAFRDGLSEGAHLTRSRGRTVAIGSHCRFAISAAQDAGSDWLVTVWDLARRRSVAVFPHINGGRDLAVAITPDGSTAVSASGTGIVKVWDVGARTMARTLSQEQFLLGAGLSEDGKRAVTTTNDGSTHLRVRVWDLVSAEVTGRGHDKAVTAVALSPDSSVALSGSSDGSVRAWDGRTGTLKRTLCDPRDLRIVTGAAIDSSARMGIASFLGGELWSWDLERCCVLEDPLTQPPIEAMVWSEADGVVATISPRRLGLWHLPTRGEASIGLPNNPDAVALLPGCTRVVINFRDRLAVYSLETGEELATVSDDQLGFRAPVVLGVVPGTGEVITVSMSLGGEPRTSVIHFLTPESLSPIRTLEAQAAVLAISVSPEGDRLVSAHEDGAIRVWDLATYQCRAVAVLDHLARAVAIRGATLLVGDVEGSLHCFDYVDDSRASPGDAATPGGSAISDLVGKSTPSTPGLVWREEDPRTRTERKLLRATFEFDAAEDPALRSQLAARVHELEVLLLPEDQQRVVMLVAALRESVARLVDAGTGWWARAVIPGGPVLFYYAAGGRYPSDLFSAQDRTAANRHWAIIHDQKEQRFELWIEGHKFGNLQEGEVGKELARALADPHYR